MELQEGFIVGIYNYCDRWCEACAFTSRCRSFALEAEIQARLDRSLNDVIPPREQAGEITEQIVHVQFSTREPTKELAQLLRPEHRPIEARAKAYAFHAARWLADNGLHAHGPQLPSNPTALLGRYLFFITGKVFRALIGLAAGEDDRDQHDANGSAKAALIGIERSHAAWLELVSSARMTPTQAEPFIGELIWLGDELERVFPKARAFIRPAFDEPDEVARLESVGTT